MKNLFEINLNKIIMPAKFSNYIYLNNPKCASSSLKYQLLLCEYWRKNLDFFPSKRKIHNVAKHEIFVENWYSSRINFSQLNRWFVFSFVRNPFIRILSAYLSRIIRKTPTSKYLSKLTGKDLNEILNLSFEQFMEIILECPPEQDDSHWRPQSSQILVSYIPIHFLGYVEYFSYDLEIVQKKIFGDAFGDKSSSRKNQFLNSTNSVNFLREHYTNKSKHLVLSKYKDDFEIFGYSDNINTIYPIQIVRNLPQNEKNSILINAYSLFKKNIKGEAISQLQRGIEMFSEEKFLFNDYLERIGPLETPRQDINKSYAKLAQSQEKLKQSQEKLRKQQQTLRSFL